MQKPTEKPLKERLYHDTMVISRDYRIITMPYKISQHSAEMTLTSTSSSVHTTRTTVITETGTLLQGETCSTYDGLQ